MVYDIVWSLRGHIDHLVPVWRAHRRCGRTTGLSMATSTRPARQRVAENERLTKALLQPVKRWCAGGTPRRAGRLFD
jgi:hypothetical protein